MVASGLQAAGAPQHLVHHGTHAVAVGGLEQGAAVLSDAELLAIFLRVGLRGKSAVDLARQLIGRFGSLNRLFAASQAEFSTIPGMGPAKFAQLQAVIEMSRRALGEEMKGSVSDLKNLGNLGRYGGACSAAGFLEQFVEGDIPWAHLDIAGTAWKSGKDKGATGRPVPLLTQFLLSRAGVDQDE